MNFISICVCVAFVNQCECVSLLTQWLNHHIFTLFFPRELFIHSYPTDSEFWSFVHIENFAEVRNENGKHIATILVTQSLSFNHRRQQQNFTLDLKVKLATIRLVAVSLSHSLWLSVSRSRIRMQFERLISRRLCWCLKFSVILHLINHFSWAVNEFHKYLPNIQWNNHKTFDNAHENLWPKWLLFVFILVFIESKSDLLLTRQIFNQ